MWQYLTKTPEFFMWKKIYKNMLSRTSSEHPLYPHPHRRILLVSFDSRPLPLPLWLHIGFVFFFFFPDLGLRMGTGREGEIKEVVGKEK